MIQRMQYLDRMIRSRDNDFVKILTGVRRSGKSTLLRMYRNWLVHQQEIDPDDIIEISFEKHDDEKYKDNRILHAHVRENAVRGRKLYLLLDEVQEMTEWAQAINSLRVSFDIDIYITGSNATLFSGEHLTYLAGRYIDIKVYPLSFAEYLDFKGSATTERPIRLFEEYIRNGSFPAVALMEDIELIRTINQGLFDSIFTRDILMRGVIRDPGNFLKVAKFVFENIGSPISANNISNVLRSEGSSLKADTIDNYLKLMCDAYMIYRCERFDIRGKNRLRTNGKYYVVDIGISSQLIGPDSSNKGHILENLIYLELLRSGCQIQTGRKGDVKIDFLAHKGNEMAYVQVSWSIMDEQTRHREMSAFSNLPDAYPRIVISMDAFYLSENGIRHVYAVDFLLGKIKLFE